MKQFGLLGEKLSYSFSPQIHEIIFNFIGEEYLYDLVEISLGSLNAKFPEIIHKYHGLNVTIPYKKDVIELLDVLDNISSEIGAVNTIKVVNGKLEGYNTDYFGFGATLDKYNVSIINKKAYILGTGGASKAVYYYLKNNNIGDIVFVNRKPETHWAKDCRIITYEECKNESGDLVINATPLGMDNLSDQSPLCKDTLSNFHSAIDLIYNPRETIFLKHARELGLQSINGLYMLVAQAIKSEEIWNDIKIDDVVINKIFHEIEKIIY
ncbi:shikimate dehydrogenase [Alkalibaculum sp. M08DMB]|uniref:Shikimate dehydrogenase (NADP(+)) n=1 Tax=Alkalibaculum sporogenes TaxID=2655001 RepID=A0A6A7KAN8_9FIRM|nr:shikimate dehydrogenase [Alkalibaculum sporogenes]MPW26588.1 shikimate dehydrogenase [Alkalibaculum sporogenes]